MERQQSAYLDLTMISADLKRGWFSGQETSALAWVDSSAKKWTSIVSNDGSNVQWQYEKLRLSLDGDDNVSQGKLLTIEIYARGMLGVRLLGSVYVPLIELASNGEESGNTILMYQIVQPSGTQEGSLKFSARVLHPNSSDALVSASGTASHPASPARAPGDDPNSFGLKAVYPSPSGTASHPASPARALGDDSNSYGFKAVYPSPSETRGIETTDERPLSEGNLPYHYPPQLHSPETVRAYNDSWQQDKSPDMSHGLGSYPPHVYPSANADYPTHTSPACYWPHLNLSSNIPHPPPPSPRSLEMHHPPHTSVFTPPNLCSGSPYPPIAPHPQFPQTIPQHPPEMYSSASFYPHSSCLCPFHPPPTCCAQQQANARHY